MVKIRFLLLIVICAFSIEINAQSSFVPLNRDYHHLVDRKDIQGNSMYTSQKPYRRDQLFYDLYGSHDTKVAKNGIVSSCNLYKNSPIDSFFVNDNWEFCPEPLNSRFSKPLNWLFVKNEAFVAIRTGDFFLSASPVLGLAKNYDLNNEDSLFQNTRGVQLRGSIGDKLGFYSFISENQFRYPQFYRNQIDSNGVIPSVGFYKKFKQTGHDFFTARGYITFSPIEQIGIQFGHDQNFIGDGYRSLIWSDNGKENLFLKIQTQVWKLKYMNMFSELSDVDEVIGNGTGIGKKYSTFHHLVYQVTPKLHIGVFEQILFDRSDSNTTRGYELNYLNPMIFYRAVEHGLNSADNVILGMDWKWNFLNRFSFYGQMVLDEFKKDEMFNRTGWWANKWASQMGLKYINAFNINFLDLQFESNIVRPYTFTHHKKSQNYSNYGSSMVHPLGANFREQVYIARYLFGPNKKMNLTTKLILSKQGLDSSKNSTINFGGDLQRDYNSRPKDHGIKIGDGLMNEIMTLEARFSYQAWHNLFADLTYIYRKQSNVLTGENKDSYFGFGIRYQLPYKSLN